MGFFSVMLFNNAPKNNYGDADKTISLHQSQMHLELTGTFFFLRLFRAPFPPTNRRKRSPPCSQPFRGPSEPLGFPISLPPPIQPYGNARDPTSRSAQPPVSATFARITASQPSQKPCPYPARYQAGRSHAKQQTKPRREESGLRRFGSADSVARERGRRIGVKSPVSILIRFIRDRYSVCAD